MKVKIIEPCYVEGKGRKAGEVVDTRKASLLIGLRKAVAVSDEKAEQEVDVGQGEAEILISDSVRDLAIENGVDLSQVNGTGKDGRITKKDVEAVLAARDDDTESLTQR